MKPSKIFSEERRYVLLRDLFITVGILMGISLVFGMLLALGTKKPDVRFIDGRSFDDFISELDEKGVAFCQKKGYIGGFLQVPRERLEIYCYKKNQDFENFDYREALK